MASTRDSLNPKISLPPSASWLRLEPRPGRNTNVTLSHVWRRHSGRVSDQCKSDLGQFFRPQGLSKRPEIKLEVAEGSVDSRLQGRPHLGDDVLHLSSGSMSPTR